MGGALSIPLGTATHSEQAPVADKGRNPLSITAPHGATRYSVDVLPDWPRAINCIPVAVPLVNSKHFWIVSAKPKPQANRETEFMSFSWRPDL